MTAATVIIVAIVIAFILGVGAAELGHWMDKRKDDRIADRANRGLPWE